MSTEKLSNENKTEALNKHGVSGSGQRFNMPTDKQLIDFALLFNDGKIEIEKLSQMVGMCELILDRLQEHGDCTRPSSKEAASANGGEAQGVSDGFKDCALGHNLRCKCEGECDY